MSDLAHARRPWPLLLHGSAGTGKTSAALAVTDFAVTAAFLTEGELCDQLMAGDDPDIWTWIASKELATLDEIGTREKVGDLRADVVVRFADARDGKPTIFISNLAPKELLPLYGDRVFSRIGCGTWFHLEGSDRRFSQ